MHFSLFIYKYRSWGYRCLYFSRTTGLYTKTMGRIINQDLSRFMAVFVVIFLPFCLALFLSLRSHDQNQYFRLVLTLSFPSLYDYLKICSCLACLYWVMENTTRASFSGSCCVNDWDKRGLVIKCKFKHQAPIQTGIYHLRHFEFYIHNCGDWFRNIIVDPSDPVPCSNKNWPPAQKLIKLLGDPEK